MEFPRTSVITIQGGGAVAIDLIGQLQGLTGRAQDDAGLATGDLGLLPAAVSGTSAGAIIATLYWAGFSPEAIRDRVAELFSPSQVGAFFGRGGWRWLPIRFRQFATMAEAVRELQAGGAASVKYLLRPVDSPWLFLGWVAFLVFALVLAHLLASLPLGLVWRGTLILLPLWRLPGLLYSICATAASAVSRHGVFPGDGMMRAIDQLLRVSPKLAPLVKAVPPTRMVRFSDVAALTDMFPLFLIVTDVARADIIVVSSIDQDSRDIEIAAAARASGGFPGFFQPVRLSDDHEICVDGGVISNFPAWVFGQDYRDKLRASGLRLPVAFAGLPWLHVGLRLPVDAAPSPHSFQGFLSCLVGLLTGRARARLDDKLASIPVKRRWVTATPPPAAEAPSNVLDFSALSRQELIGHAFDRGRRDGQLAIDPDLFRWPADAEIKPFLATLAERASALLGPWLVAGSLVRVNIFLPEGGDLVLAYHANMDGDPDENIRLSHGQGITSLVYSQRLTSIADITPRQQDPMSPTQEDDPYLRGPGAPAIRGDRTWLISVPLIDLTEMSPARTANAPLVLDVDGPVLGVLNVDAAIDYQASGAPLPNVGAANHWAVLALFDTMKSTIFQCGMVLNQRFLQPSKTP